MATEGNDDLPVPDLRTMEELCQPSLNGRGGPIAPIAIQATNFGLKNDMIQQVQNSYQFHGLPGDDANKHLDKFLHVTQSIKMAKMFLGKYFPPSMVTKFRNEITNFRQHPDESLFEAWEHYKLSTDRCPNHNMLPITQIDTFYNGLTLRHRDTINAAVGGTFMKRLTPNCETCGGPHSFNDFPATIGQTQNVYAARVYQGTLPGNTITNLKEELKGITTRSETTYQGPTIPTTSSSLPLVVERETEATKDIVHPTNNGSTKVVQPPVVQTESPILNSEPIISPTIEPVVAPVSAPKPNQKPSIPYLSRIHDQKLHKLSELARTPLNEHCSAVLLKKLLEKLGDPGKFLIPCDFSGIAECLALADLNASINLMPLSMWNKLSLPELSPTSMTLELADHSISHPVGAAKDVFVKTGSALIDVFEGELTLRVGKEAITFNLDQTSRYSANYNDTTANRIDFIDMACEEYSQEVLGFSDVIASGNPTPYYDPIVSTSSLNLTPFGESDFLLEEVDAFLALEDDPTSPKVDQSYFDPEGDILLLEAILNNDPSLPPSNQGNYLP
nr:reverse transcriptase domain-containing protein [Tanacetum cinerariifolium]